MNRILILIALCYLFAGCDSDNAKHEYYPSGKFKSTFYVDNDGLVDGKKIFFHQNDSVQKIQYFKHGISDGLCEEFDSSGRRVCSYEYKNDTVTGKMIEYYKDGTVYSLTMYAKNKINGNVSYYYPDGRIKMMSIFDEDSTKCYFEFKDQELAELTNYGIKYSFSDVPDTIKLSENNVFEIIPYCDDDLKYLDCFFQMRNVELASYVGNTKLEPAANSYTLVIPKDLKPAQYVIELFFQPKPEYILNKIVHREKQIVVIS